MVVFPALLLALLSTAAQTPLPSEMVYRLALHPMPAPKPALRYALLPELKELTPGNPIEGYLAVMLDRNFSEERDTLTPSALKAADRAARMDKPDWQILPRLKVEGLGLLLPDIQKCRELASGLQDRFRTEIAQGRFDDAIVTMKTMLALSRHMGEHPTLIADLVGIAIGQIGLGTLQEMLEQPGCPNLYWALTNLPGPFISLDKGLDGERVMIDSELRDLSDDRPMTPGQIRKLIERIDYLRDATDAPRSQRTRALMDAKLRDDAYMTAARKRLADFGLSADRLDSFPADQILLLDQKQEYEIQRDEIMKFMKLPTWEVGEYMKGIDTSIKARDATLFGSLVPALYKVRLAQGRIEQRIALLRHIEAIRLYAADHKGQLPEKLGDITVPLPPDPMTGKTFRYVREGAVAHLRGSAPPGQEKIAAYNLHYEITIKSP